MYRLAFHLCVFIFAAAAVASQKTCPSGVPGPPCDKKPCKKHGYTCIEKTCCRDVQCPFGGENGRCSNGKCRSGYFCNKGTCCLENSCPVFPAVVDPGCSTTTIPDKCKNDKDCKKGELCCRTNCGNMYCKGAQGN
ncbi:uncharacterized protein K04H4.2-like [Dreissena polymorpha]|uniref:WAP domain-containing protein n=1 Tax=Dreissena polymorpha TaxID=45954 RepID=A0A9D4LCE2_DREPO|nr:uncharacterized protein K04H4.2-like [Dreissena polymorpha]KAH3855213.1 hypothetical protein DPMN_097777 [Dreissena polymorpha]